MEKFKAYELIKEFLEKLPLTSQQYEILIQAIATALEI